MLTEFPRNDKERLCKAIFVASCWHSDRADGVSLLSLSSTRTVHSEDHRRQLAEAIDRCILWNRSLQTSDEANDPKRDIPLLIELRSLVEVAVIGQEWLTDNENQTINERLYQAGQLQ